MQLEGLVDFLKCAGKLKRLPRTGWVESGVDEPESVADHSYRTALIAMILSDLQGFDTAKAIRMALLHDIAEAEMGDLTPRQKEDKGPTFSNEERETAARLLSKLPGNLAGGYIALLEEFFKMPSPEAKVVANADKVDMVLQAIEYEEEDKRPTSLQRFLHADVGEGLPREIVKETMRKRMSGGGSSSTPLTSS